MPCKTKRKSSSEPWFFELPVWNTDKRDRPREQHTLQLVEHLRCPWFWSSINLWDSRPNCAHSWMTNSWSLRRMCLDHVRTTRLFECLETNRLDFYPVVLEFRSTLTMWTGDVDLQRTTVCVGNGHVELNMFEKANDIVFSFTTSNLKVHFQRMAGTDFSTRQHEQIEPSAAQYTYCASNLTGSISQMLCFGAVTHVLAASVKAAAFKRPKPKRLFTSKEEESRFSSDRSTSTAHFVAGAICCPSMVISERSVLRCPSDQVLHITPCQFRTKIKRQKRIIPRESWANQKFTWLPRQERKCRPRAVPRLINKAFWLLLNKNKPSDKPEVPVWSSVHELWRSVVV